MWFCLLAAGLFLLQPVLHAAETEVQRITSVVRADPKTGRLVRRTFRVEVPATNVPAVQPEKRKSGGAAAASEPSGSGAEGETPEEIGSIVDKAAQTHNLDPLLVHSVIAVESNYDPLAVSPKGAEGLMQLIPSTARRFGVDDSFDPRQNIEAGVRYLRYLKDRFQDDRLALAAYNAGEGAVERFKGIPPFSETKQYVERVGQKYREALANQSPQREAAPEVPITLTHLPRVQHLEQYVDQDGKLHLRTR